MSEQPKRTDQPSEQLTFVERIIQALLTGEGPVFTSALGRWMFRLSVETGPEDSVISVATRLTESHGQLFLKEVGHHYGIQAVTFDFEGKHYPITILRDPAAHPLPTPVLWSKQVEWARKKAISYQAAHLMR